jgi:hypothetical protein
VAYLVECRTTALHAALDAQRVLAQALESLGRSQVVRDPGLALEDGTRRLRMTARVESAETTQAAAVLAANELLWRLNQYCGDDEERHVRVTHLSSRLAGA